MAFLAEACFEVYTMFYGRSWYTIVSVSRNYWVTNSHLSGNFFIHGFVFSVWHKWQFWSLNRENLFLSIWAIILMVQALQEHSRLFFPALYILYPSLCGHKGMVGAQIEVKSVAFSNGLLNLKPTQCHISLSKDIKFGQNVPHAVGEEHNISYVTEIIYFWFHWLLTNDKWPLPPKSELLSFIDEHKFSTPIFHKLLVFHGG